MSASRPAPHRPKRSQCADESLRAEIERVAKMSIEERIRAALSMGKRLPWTREIGKRP